MFITLGNKLTINLAKIIFIEWSGHGERFTASVTFDNQHKREFAGDAARELEHAVNKIPASGGTGQTGSFMR